MRERFARRNGQKVGDFHALKSGRLLEGIRNTALCAVSDGKAGNVFAVQQDLPAGRRGEAHDQLGKRRLAAAVRAGNDKEFSVFYVQRDVFDDVRASLRVSRSQAKILECEHVCSSFILNKLRVFYHSLFICAMNSPFFQKTFSVFPGKFRVPSCTNDAMSAII